MLVSVLDTVPDLSHSDVHVVDVGACLIPNEVASVLNKHEVTVLEFINLTSKI